MSDSTPLKDTRFRRRHILLGGAAVATVAWLPPILTNADATSPSASKRRATASTVLTRDGASIFYKDWGHGKPIVFSHGWPLNADAWDEQLFFFASMGYRAIAYDRRGHGRSSQTWNGNNMDTYADDLAALIETLDLRDVTVVGHSSGGGDVVRYLGRHGAERVARASIVSAVPPLLLKTSANPGGLPLSSFDDSRAGLERDKAQFYKDIAAPFFGANRPGSKVAAGLLQQFWLQCMQAGYKGAYDCIKAFSETDFTEDLKRIDVPVLVLHGEDDQFVPVNNTAKRSSQLLTRSTLKIYPDAPHGLIATHRDQFNADLLAFIRGS